MALKVLLTTLVFSPKEIYFAGQLIDDVADDVAKITDAGGVLVPTGDPIIDAAARIARARWASGDKSVSDVEMADAKALSDIAATGSPTTPLAALRSARQAEAVDIAVGWTGAETRSVRVENAGLLKVDYADGGVDILVPVAAGIPNPMAITKITAAGSTVTGKVVVEW